jgi:predicted small metal-binding protein
MAELNKMKNFACRDAGMSCDWKTSGKTEDEILENVRKHAESEHKDVPFTDQVRNKVRSLIRSSDQKTDQKVA